MTDLAGEGNITVVEGDVTDPAALARIPGLEVGVGGMENVFLPLSGQSGGRVMSGTDVFLQRIY